MAENAVGVLICRVPVPALRRGIKTKYFSDPAEAPALAAHSQTAGSLAADVFTV